VNIRGIEEYIMSLDMGNGRVYLEEWGVGDDLDER